jgi:acetylornithine deacetylase
VSATLELLKRLIAVDSVNPSLVPGGAGEREIAGVIERELRGIGLDVEREDAAPGRPNVVGVLEGRASGRTLMLCGHTDTVGVAGMPGAFQPSERDGRIHGRGAEDMKGGVAAMIGTARALVGEGGLARGRLIVACVVDEEYGSVGAEALVERWRADAAVVPEPTNLEVAIAHKGFAMLRVVTKGRAAHGSRPKDGRDAIVVMGPVLVALGELDRELQARPPRPLLGTGSLHAGTIRGGREVSTYPDECVLDLERRTLPGEPDERVVGDLEAILQRLRREDATLEAECRLVLSRRPLETPADHELPRALLAAVSRHAGSREPCAMTFWTDAALLAEAGIPSVVFGPGGGGLHTPDEFVRASDVLACEASLVELARVFCEGRPAPV